MVMLGSLGSMMLILLGQPEAANSVSESVRPLMLIVAGSFLITLVPRRLSKLEFYPARFWAYLRLKRVEKRVRQLTLVQFLTQEPPVQIWFPQELELAIYRSLIFVLDYHALLRTTIEGETLYLQIQQIIHNQTTYDDLVNEIRFC